MILTADDARAVSKSLREAADGIFDFIDAREQTLSNAQISQLNDSAKLLLSQASKIRTEAVDLAIAELERPAGELQATIAAAKDKIEALNDIGKVIQIAAGFVSLAEGILAKSPKAVVGALKDVKDAIA